MTFLELFIIAVALSMDAFAVSVAKGLSVERLRPRNIVSVALWFGGFQGLMPVIGFYLGVSFASFVDHVDHWIAFVLLALIGINMIRGAFSKKEDKISADFSFRTMLMMAIATSIDAFAVGVSFSFFNANIWTAALLIALTTALFSAIGIYVGNIFGGRFRSVAEFAGGFILLLVGIKILIEHIWI
ncbi:MAG: manganese efflux pump [Bacteroidales bacterium]|nr:manganese efflux pump [Bacteroidales bacterium]